MAKKIDREGLIAAVDRCTELTDKQKEDLRQLLSEQKTYGLVWENTPEKAYDDLRAEVPVMREDEDRRIFNGDDCPNHMIIEGENLKALTNLCYTHAGKIGVIYIDPPYNTGNKDFVYNDKFIDAEESYRHSMWLSFMKRRLVIAKNLLSDNGVIFISIDDNEQANLKLLCDEVFNEKNFIADLIWQKKFSRANDALYFSTMHDHILCYCKKNIAEFPNEGWHIGLLDRVGEIPKGYSNPDNDSRGVWTSTIMSAKSGSDSLLYEVTTPGGRVVTPPSGRYWSCSKDTFEKWKSENRIWFGKDGNGTPRKKTFLSEVQSGLRPNTLILQEIGGNNQEGKQELKAIFGGDGVFDGPKPTKLLKLLLRIANCKEAKILDFFAGSGTTLDATMKLNAEDGGHRQCILVTNNENGICENVTYPRNKKVIEGYTTPKGEQIEGLHENNLRYFKMEAVPRKPTVKNRKLLAAGMVDMLRVKHNVYTQRDHVGALATNPSTTRYYEDDGHGLLILMDPTCIGAMVEAIRAMPQPITIEVYVYSDGSYAYDDDFAAVADKVSVAALPSPFLRTFNRIAPEMEKE